MPTMPRKITPSSIETSSVEVARPRVSSKLAVLYRPRYSIMSAPMITCSTQASNAYWTTAMCCTSLKLKL